MNTATVPEVCPRVGKNKGTVKGPAALIGFDYFDGVFVAVGIDANNGTGADIYCLAHGLRQRLCCVPWIIRIGVALGSLFGLGVVWESPCASSAIDRWGY